MEGKHHSILQKGEAMGCVEFELGVLDIDTFSFCWESYWFGGQAKGIIAGDLAREGGWIQQMGSGTIKLAQTSGPNLPVPCPISSQLWCNVILTDEILNYLLLCIWECLYGLSLSKQNRALKAVDKLKSKEIHTKNLYDKTFFEKARMW